MDKKYNFVYITTNLINNKKYLGKRSTDNLDDNYLGSGALLKKAINKYGKENFKREILSFHNSEIEAYEEEKLKAKELNVRFRDDFYNLTDCGEGNNYWKGRRRSIEDRIKFSKSHKGKIPWNKGVVGELNPQFGHITSEETKKKISLAHIGRKASEDVREKLRISHIGLPNKNKGKKGLFQHSEETKNKMSISRKGFRHSQETKNKLSNDRVGVPKSQEHRDKLSKSLIGKKQSIETIEKRRVKLIGRKMPKDLVDRIKESKRLKPIKKCLWCEYESNNYGVLARFHNNNCKNNPNKIYKNDSYEEIVL